MNTIEETNDKDYPYKIRWGNKLSWSLCRSKEEAENLIKDIELNGNEWLTKPRTDGIFYNT